MFAHRSVMLLVVAVTACKGEPAPRPAPEPSARAVPDSAPAEPQSRAVPDSAAAAPPCTEIAPLPSRLPAADRVVAIGDLHGDLAAARRALILAGAMDANDRWVGGDLVVVQTGDVLDRGDDEQAILDLLARLADQARAAGGAVHALLGNHETMNASGDFRYVTPGGWADFEHVPPVVPAAGANAPVPGLAATLERLPPEYRPRVAAFAPGGPYARQLAHSNAVLMVGDTVFVHGGVLPAWAEYGIERINHELRCWLAGHIPPPDLLGQRDNPLWSRDYSATPERCDLLERALETLGATRMVMGHTPQRAGITSACDGRAWRIDTGMAAHYGGPTQVLEIKAGIARPLGAEPSQSPAL